MNKGDYMLQDIGGQQMILSEVVEVLNTNTELYKVIIRYANEPFYTDYTTRRKSREFKTMPNPNTQAPSYVSVADIPTVVAQYDMKKVEEFV